MIRKLFSTFSKKNIKNLSLHSCSNCINNIPHERYNYYDLEDNRYLLSRCKKFAYKDYLSGYIVYEYARNCREDPKKCGLKAKFFSPKEVVNLK